VYVATLLLPITREAAQMQLMEGTYLGGYEYAPSNPITQGTVNLKDRSEDRSRCLRGTCFIPVPR